MFHLNSLFFFFIIFSLFYQFENSDVCKLEEKSKCNDISSKYSEQTNLMFSEIKKAQESFKPCNDSFSCYNSVIQDDLSVFKDGITEDMINAAEKKGTKYQIINGRIYRDKSCMFPARCSGIEYFLSKVKSELPDVEFIVNTRDWPQVHSQFDRPIPVFSFSKTKSYYDIMYPTWSFWSGGPAISLYPTGIGRWDLHRKSIKQSASKWLWTEKRPIAFFRGSRTSDERDQLILLSRDSPELIDAAFTKNQAWKSDKDTLYAPPAKEVSLEDHCQYKYLFNFRGVAASFRLKHLFLCKSLVFHVGDEWIEFFYPALKKWIHYVPIQNLATKDELRSHIEFFKEHDDVAKEIADNGFSFISTHLKLSNVEWYWRNLLNQYASLLKFKPVLNTSLILIK